MRAERSSFFDGNTAICAMHLVSLLNVRRGGRLGLERVNFTGWTVNRVHFLKKEMTDLKIEGDAQEARDDA